MRYIQAAAFQEYLRKCLRAAGHFQQELADEMHIDAKVLSRKLRGTGDSHLFDDDVKRIIRILARWRVISTRSEAYYFLELAQLQPDIFREEEWHTSPLDQLEEGEPLHNLSVPLTRFVGREELVGRLRSLLARDDTRLVTLVGAGGSGKTRLAQHVAGELTAIFAQGVWTVMLAPVRDPSLVLQSIMQTLSIQSLPDSSPTQSLIVYLRHKKLLLILDNLEQVADAADLVGELLAAAPGLKILVTSRAVLRLSGEFEFKVPPMNLPEASKNLAKETAERYDAVQLFVERARLAAPDFALTDDNAATIAQICARVDGLPLALELAAARIKLLTPTQLLDKLSGARLAVLKGGRRDMPERHQTLLKTIQWSYNLLAPATQAWFARLGIFDGGWSLDAVEAMMQALADPPHGDDDDLSLSDSALDLLDSLFDNSLLVKPAATEAQERFTLLETLREYALGLLHERGEIERLRNWHACYFLGLAEKAELGLRGAQQMAWLARLRAEQDNFRAALRWSLEQAKNGNTLRINASGTELCSTEVSLRLAASIRPFWEWQGYLFEARTWLEAALALPLQERVERTTQAARAKALCGLARLHCLQNAQEKSIAAAEEGISLWRQLDDHAGLAMGLFQRGWPAISQGDYALAKKLFEQSLPLIAADDAWLRGQVIFLLGDLAGFDKDYELMRSYFARSMEIFEQIGDRSSIADQLKDHSGMAVLEGDFEWAVTNLSKSIAISQELGYMQFIGTGMGLLGFAVSMRGKPDERSAIIQALHLWGASSGLLGTIGSIPHLSNFPIVQETLVRYRASLDDDTWKQAFRYGRSLTVDQAMTAFRELEAAHHE